MSKHPTSLEIDRQIPAAEAAPGLDVGAKPASPPALPAKKSGMRKPLLLGAG